MNTTFKKVAISLICGSLSILASQVQAQDKQATHNKVNTQNQTQTVTITAKRMNAEQKAYYDATQANSRVQTVVISAKRVTQK